MQTIQNLNNPRLTHKKISNYKAQTAKHKYEKEQTKYTTPKRKLINRNKHSQQTNTDRSVSREDIHERSYI